MQIVLPVKLGHILHVPFLRIHHHYVTYCWPYVVNVVLLTGQESNTMVFVTLKKRKKEGIIPFPGPGSCAMAWVTLHNIYKACILKSCSLLTFFSLHLQDLWRVPVLCVCLQVTQALCCQHGCAHCLGDNHLLCLLCE